MGKCSSFRYDLVEYDSELSCKIGFDWVFMTSFHHCMLLKKVPKASYTHFPNIAVHVIFHLNLGHAFFYRADPWLLGDESIGLKRCWMFNSEGPNAVFPVLLRLDAVRWCSLSTSTRHQQENLSLSLVIWNRLSMAERIDEVIRSDDAHSMAKSR